MKTEIERIQELLSTELFEGSKDWREGNTVERVEWLLSMYASAKEEVERLQDIEALDFVDTQWTECEVCEE